MQDMLWKFLFSTFFLPSLQVSSGGPVQCFDSCTSMPSLLALKPTIGDCCGVQGENAGGFLTAGGTICTDCSRFRTLTAKINISSIPMVAVLDSRVKISCKVQTEEIVCPSGNLFLQLPNGTVITTMIRSSMSKIELVIAAASLDDLGRYYCNISIISPQFPNIGLRAFEGLLLSTPQASVSPSVSLLTIPNGIRPTTLSSVPTVSITTSVTSTSIVIPLPTEVDIMPTAQTQTATTNIIPTRTIPNQTSIKLNISTDGNPDFISVLESMKQTSTTISVINTDILRTLASDSPIASASVLPTVLASIIPMPSTLASFIASASVSPTVLASVSPTALASVSPTALALVSPTALASVPPIALASVSPIALTSIIMSSTSASLILSDSVSPISPLPSSPILLLQSSSMLLPSPIPPDPTISCLKHPIIGRKYKLTCHSNKLNFKMLWTSSNIRRIQSDANIIVGKIKRDYYLGESSLTIYFKPFLMEHIGIYTCWSDTNSLNVLISV